MTSSTNPLRSILVIGATSAIAQAVARLFAAEGCRLFLVGRDQAKLELVAGDLRARGAEAVGTYAADLANIGIHDPLLASALSFLGDCDAALIAHGVLPDQARCDRDPDYAAETFQVNLVSAVSLLLRIADYFERRGRGTIAAISSVAGDRVRRSNYVYGTAKAGLSAFLVGLRARFARSKVRIVTIKPGFVDTPMTAGLRKNPLYSDATSVARGIHRGMKRGRSVVYVPGFWRAIMLAVRLVPERIFSRLSL